MIFITDVESVMGIRATKGREERKCKKEGLKGLGALLPSLESEIRKGKCLTNDS